MQIWIVAPVSGDARAADVSVKDTTLVVDFANASDEVAPSDGFVEVPPGLLPTGLSEYNRATPTDATGGPPYFSVNYRNDPGESPRRSLNVAARYGMSDATAENEAIFGQDQADIDVSSVTIRGHEALLARYAAPTGGEGLVLGWAEDSGTLVQITSSGIDSDTLLAIAQELTIEPPAG